MNLHRRALGRARARYFCRHKSIQKGLQQKGFFALILPSNPPPGLCPAKRTEPRAAIILPRFALSPASAKTCYAPAATHSLHCSARFHPKLICCEKHPVLIMSWAGTKDLNVSSGSLAEDPDVYAMHICLCGGRVSDSSGYRPCG